MRVGTQLGPDVEHGAVTFAYRDTRPSVRLVKLAQEVRRPRLGPAFARRGRSRLWELRFVRPAVDRMEYQLEVTHADGGTELICDPANPLRAGGPFGDKSVVEFPEYRPPAWLDEQPGDGQVVELSIPSRALRTRVPVAVWSSPGSEPGRPLPLLVVHDGPELAQYASLLHLLGARTASGDLPPLRAALVQPVRRNDTYSASAAYARTLANELLPAIQEVAPNPRRRRMRVGMGSSLGALAMLHVHRNHPETFGALFLQSGSFFRRHREEYEAGFERYERIVRFTAKVHAARDTPDPIQVAITCGTVEENLPANRAIAASLAAQGYDVRLHENRDAHNWVAWRDTFDPWLVDLLRSKWS